MVHIALKHIICNKKYPVIVPDELKKTSVAYIEQNKARAYKFTRILFFMHFTVTH